MEDRDDLVEELKTLLLKQICNGCVVLHFADAEDHVSSVAGNHDLE
jgi:hypothetical protein